MSRSRDPVQRRENDDSDRHGVTGWEPRTVVDRFLYAACTTLFRVAIVVAAVVVLLWQLTANTDGPVLTEPFVVVFVFLSAIPALVLAAYVWYADVTTRPQPRLLVVSFLLGFLFVGFAGILNAVLSDGLTDILEPVSLPENVLLGLVFLVVVAPIEEALKLLAVHIYAYRSERFNSVMSGAVYGAAAGLGFATMENAVIITREIAETGSLVATANEGGAVATVRAFVGPGHVIYSAFAGYYLGLARFNRAYAGPILLKGLLLAIGLHASYNTLVSTDALAVPELIANVSGLSTVAGEFVFILAFNGVLIAVLIYKLSQYRAAYQDAHDGRAHDSDLTEFERGLPVESDERR